MKISSFLLACSVVLLPVTAFAQQVCPCVPVSHQWVVEACDTWNCAAAATIMANGDKYVLAIPTNSDDHPWLILKRIATGSVTVSPDAPFAIEAFDDTSSAIARYHAIDAQLQPMIVSGADGKFLVVARSATAAGRSRSAKH